MHSMQAYQRAFGIEWQDEEVTDGSQRNFANSHLPPRPLAERRESNTSAKSRENDESRRIANVRERCVAQNQGKIKLVCQTPILCASALTNISVLYYLFSSICMVEDGNPSQHQV